MESARTHQIIADWFAAIGRGDFETVMATLADDIVFTLPKDADDAIIPYLGRMEGKAAVAEAFRIRGETTEVLDYRTRNLIAEANQACAIIYTRGRHTESLVEFEIEDAHWFRVNEDGTIATWTVYFNPDPEVDAFRAATTSELLKAVGAGDADALGHLLDLGADADTRDPDSGLTLLMLASGRGDAALVQALLDHGADVFRVDPKAGASALHKACQGGSLKVVQLLCAAGAPVDWVATSTGHTPLMDAIWFKYPAIVGYLLDHGAGLECTAHYGFSLAQHLEYELGVTEHDQTELRQAAAMVQARRDRDAALTASQRLLAAAAAGDLEAATAALAAGEDADQRAPMTNSFNDAHTPLLVAARDGHEAIVDLLLEHGADVNAVEPTFLAVPLHKAVYNGHVAITRRLAAAPGIELNFQGATNGYTPLHDALWHGYAECAEVLVEAGARLDQLGHDGKSPLDLAREKLGDEHALTRRIAGWPA